jgi:hypothetical protein
VTLAVVAPAGFVGIEVAVGLLGLLMVLVCIALRGVWIHTLGYVFLKLAALSLPLGRLSHPHPFGKLKQWDADVLNFLHHQQETGSHIAGYFFHAAAILLGWMARELRELAGATLHALDKLEHAHLPKWTRAMVYALFPPALIARLIQLAVHKGLIGVLRGLVMHAVHSAIHIVGHIAHAAEGVIALPKWVIHVPKRLGKLERDMTSTWKRLRRVEALIGVGAFAAVLAKTLGLRSVRCLKDGNIGRGARAWCATDGGLIGNLLSDLLAIAGVISVVEFAHGLQAIEDEAVAILRAGIREFPD